MLGYLAEGADTETEGDTLGAADGYGIDGYGMKNNGEVDGWLGLDGSGDGSSEGASEGGWLGSSEGSEGGSSEGS